MSGIPGPVGKRSDQVVRRNAQDPVDKVPMIGPVDIPDLGFSNPHEITLALYESLKTSGQATYYEPSDWQYARLTLHFVDKLVKASKPSAQMLASVNAMMVDLLFAEGARRKVRLEVERNAANGAVIDVAAMFRERMTQAAQQTG